MANFVDSLRLARAEKRLRRLHLLNGAFHHTGVATLCEMRDGLRLYDDRLVAPFIPSLRRGDRMCLAPRDISPLLYTAKDIGMATCRRCIWRYVWLDVPMKQADGTYWPALFTREQWGKLYALREKLIGEPEILAVLRNRGDVDEVLALLTGDGRRIDVGTVK